jgi:uncharacterized membrane protein YbhN (UPF0104 family)
MKRTWRFLGYSIVLAILCGACWLLYREVRQYSLREILDSLRQIPPLNIGLALLLTVLNYLALIGYDWLGVRAIGHPLPLRRVSLASFVSYAASYNFGALLGGTSLRYRLYSAWGLSAVEIVKLLAILSLTLWVGMCALAAVVFLIDPFSIPPGLGLPVESVRPIGIFLAVLTVGYLAICGLRRKPIRFRDWELPIPSLKLCVQQIAVASVDLLIAAAILYVLLPPTVTLHYFQFLGIYLLAVVAVLFTHVPGGIGVLELVVLVLAADDQPTPALMAGLIVFRVVYYLLPLLVAAVMFLGHEVLLHHGTWMEWRRQRDATPTPLPPEQEPVVPQRRQP